MSSIHFKTVLDDFRSQCKCNFVRRGPFANGQRFFGSVIFPGGFSATLLELYHESRRGVLRKPSCCELFQLIFGDSCVTYIDWLIYIIALVTGPIFFRIILISFWTFFLPGWVRFPLVLSGFLVGVGSVGFAGSAWLALLALLAWLGLLAFLALLTSWDFRLFVAFVAFFPCLASWSLWLLAFCFFGLVAQQKNTANSNHQLWHRATMQRQYKKHANHIIDYKTRVGSRTPSFLASTLQIAWKTSEKKTNTWKKLPNISGNKANEKNWRNYSSSKKSQLWKKTLKTQQSKWSLLLDPPNALGEALRPHPQPLSRSLFSMPSFRMSPTAIIAAEKATRTKTTRRTTTANAATTARARFGSRN